jgi:proline iminopeptidase
MDLIEDCEALRRHLGIRRWSLLGHSFGGQLALRYAAAYPDVVNAIAFENPSFDVRTSIQSLMGASANVLEAHGDREDATRARAFEISDATAGSLWQDYAYISGKLGDWRDEIYVHHPNLRGFSDRLQSRFSDDQLRRAGTHVAALVAEGKLFEDVTPLLSGLRQPMLMARGDFDFVTAPSQMRAFAAVPDGRRFQFHDSSHFIHVEEPDAFAKSLSAFVTATWRA